MNQQQTVYIGSARGNQTVYHTDKDCDRLNMTDIREVGISFVQNHRECKFCAGENKPIEFELDKHTSDCPFCGETVYALAKHLPSCPEK